MEFGSFQGFVDAAGDSELDNAAFTSRWVAAERAMESAREDALFQDPFAAALGGETGKLFSAKQKDRWDRMFGWPEYHITWMAVRTKYIDEKISKFAAALGASSRFQFVNLGAGLDTRPFRLDCLRDACSAVFEVDVAQVCDVKHKTMASLKATAVCPRISVPIDLAEDGLLYSSLLAAGFDDRKPTFWLMEGLTPYLSPDVNLSILRQIERLHSDQAHRSLQHALLSGFLGDPSVWPGDIPFKPLPAQYSEMVEGCGFNKVSVACFGDSALNFGRYPEGRGEDASQCFLYATRGELAASADI